MSEGASPGDIFSAALQAFRGEVARADHDWRRRARPSQIPPDEYSILGWVTGRGFGKNFAAANHTCELAAAGAVKRIALVAPNMDHCRQVLVEGNSGILTLAPAWCRPTYEPSKGQLTWPNGCIATLYSDQSPEALRGPEHDFAHADEIASWRNVDTWENLVLTMRIGTNPRIIFTTTPKPTRLVRELVARNGKDGVVIRTGSTYENRANLSKQFFDQLTRRFEGTRVGRQELMGELLEDVPGALWTREVLEKTRVEKAPPMSRIVIGVDPAGSAEAGADMTGIIACGKGLDGDLYVMADVSLRGTPREWAARVCGLFYSLKADKVVIEKNFGGQMAAATIASIDPAIPVKEITSSRGKALRAEPTSSLFEQNRAHLVGTMGELEEQCCAFTADWDRSRDGSPDRVDALVFAASELMIDYKPPGFFTEELLLARR